MQDKILQTASELFLNFGVKSVTMDDLATHLGISKKTIYEYYGNKEALVKATADFMFTHISAEINTLIADENSNSPIETLFESLLIFNQHFKENHAPQYQLKKYFPKVYEEIYKRKFELITNAIKKNLKQGIAQGYYREDINQDIIARFYYAGMSAIKDHDIFSSEAYKPAQIMITYTIYHIRAIATPKGLNTLEKYLSEHEL